MGSRPGGRVPPRQNDSGHKVNRDIRVPQVRIVGDNIASQGVYATSEALRLAEALELDLVMITDQADPPVCKIVDFQKFLYQQRKKQKEMKANTVKVEVKEIRFGPNTGEHDYAFKLKHAENFLKEGDKVKAYVYFRGREIMYKDQGEALLARFASELEEWGKVEMLPKLEGKRMNMVLAPKAKK